MDKKIFKHDKNVECTPVTISHVINMSQTTGDIQMKASCIKHQLHFTYGRNLGTTVYKGSNNICIIQVQFIFITFFVLLSIFNFNGIPNDILDGSGASVCSGTSSYFHGCEMSLEEIKNILISGQHNTMSTSNHVPVHRQL